MMGFVTVGASSRRGDYARALEERFAECGLELHPEKTQIVYCKDDDRRGDYPNQKFDFLGYTFRPRLARRRQGRIGVSFSPAVSDKALKAIRREVRRWQLQKRSDKSLDDIARMFNSVIRGWINYYGRYYKSALYPVLRHIDGKLVWWACRKYKSLRRHQKLARHWLDRFARRQSSLFAHWSLLWGMAGQWEPDESRGSRPVLRERRGVIPLRHSPRRGIRASCRRRALCPAMARALAKVRAGTTPGQDAPD